MRNLRLYNTDAAFKAHEQAAGGDGNDTVTVVPGVSMSSDQRKRYFNQHDESILVQEVKVNYYIGDKNIATGNTRVKFVSGVSTDGYARVTPLSGRPYQISEPYANVTLPADSSTTISAKCSPNFYIKCMYNVTTTGSTTSIYYNKPANLWGIVVDGETFVTGTSISTGRTFPTTGKHEVVFCFSGTNISLSSNAFRGCSGLTSVEISSGFTTIEHFCFYGCNSITSITIPNGITQLAPSCFRGCSSLQEITIPSGVTAVGNYCFEGCSSLKMIICNAPVAPTVYSYTFSGVAREGTLYYPSGSDYSTWLANASYYLGLYNWTGQEL